MTEDRRDGEGRILCAALTKRRSRCRQPALSNGNPFCGYHDPAGSGRPGWKVDAIRARFADPSDTEAYGRDGEP